MFSKIRLFQQPAKVEIFIFDLLRALLADDVFFRRKVFCITAPIIRVVCLDVETLEVVIEFLENRIFPRPSH